MSGGETDKSSGISSMEMLAMGGFALYFGWMYIVFYWLFCEFPPDSALLMRDFAQLFLFAAIPVGYLLAHLLAKRPDFNLFSNGSYAAMAVCSCALPVCAFVLFQGIAVPFAVVCVLNALAGVSSALIRVGWLDICSRLKTDYYSRFTGLSLFIGTLLFVLVAFAPMAMLPAFAIAFSLLSIGLLAYSSNHAEGNEDKAPLESIANTWRFTKEIEPSFFMFGLAFALSFVFLYNCGSQAVLLGLAASLVGALAVAAISIADKQLSIAVYQRILVVVVVVACVMLPFLEEPGQIACSCIVTASWSMFLAVNASYIVKKCCIAREAPLFRQAPIRLAVPAAGFAAGWALACVVMFAAGPHSQVFVYLRLGVAVVLVLIIMVFLPNKEHHAVDGSSPTGQHVTTTVVTTDVSERELFDARIAAVAKLYQLSPRETEVLGFLAKGRNAAYIQEALTISPHTVKSHIYNTYRKLDIHSQQKLMDFVEEFPLD